MIKRIIALLAVGFACTAQANVAGAVDEFRGKTFTIVVPYAAGSMTDIIARTVSKAVTDQTGINTVVVNRGGAFGTIGARQVAESTDGLTLCLCDGSNVYTNKLLGVANAVDIDALKIVTAVSNGYTTLTVPANSPFNTPQELVEFLKKNPEKSIYSNSGSVMALQSGNFLNRAGVTGKIESLTLKGDIDIQQIVIRGDVTFSFMSVASSKMLRDAGKLKVLATDFDTRTQLFPDTPTLTEIFGGNALTSFHALFVSSSVPESTRQKLNLIWARAVESEDVKAMLIKQDRQKLGYNLPDSEKFFKSQLDFTSKLIERSKKDIVIQ